MVKVVLRSCKAAAKAVETDAPVEASELMWLTVTWERSVWSRSVKAMLPLSTNWLALGDPVRSSVTAPLDLTIWMSGLSLLPLMTRVSTDWAVVNPSVTV